MTQNRLFTAALLIAGLAQASAALAAQPQVIINQGQTNSCTVTPNTGTVFNLDSSGNVLVNGAYTAGNCSSTNSGGGLSGDPTFSFNPNPANLTIANNSLGSAGGTVNPNFVAYFATSCKGNLTVQSGCAAVASTPWNGGTVCTSGSTNYCTPASAAVAIPANANTTSCTYTFQATNCTNSTTQSPASSQTATVTVAGINTGGDPCIAGDTSGELGNYGYSRQCSGTIHSFSAGVNPTWDNTYKGLMGGSDWPGNTGQWGKGISVSVNAMQYASFSFNTGTTTTGATWNWNTSYGTLGLISVSTKPGDFFGGTAVCVNSTLTITAKPNTVAGTSCKLAANTKYYLNFSSASYSGSTHDTTCTAPSCATGWTPYSYTN